MRELELESKGKEEVATNTIPVEEFDAEVRGELIRKGILILIGS